MDWIARSLLPGAMLLLLNIKRTGKPKNRKCHVPTWSFAFTVLIDNVIEEGVQFIIIQIIVRKISKFCERWTIF